MHKGFSTRARTTPPATLEHDRPPEGSTIAEDTDPSCGGFAFASGLAAMATALELIDAGSHIISMDDIYGGSNRLLQKVRRTQNLDIDFVDLTDESKLRAAMRSDTAMLWVETPTNPTLKIVDIASRRSPTRSTPSASSSWTTPSARR